MAGAVAMGAAVRKMARAAVFPAHRMHLMVPVPASLPLKDRDFYYPESPPNNPGIHPEKFSAGGYPPYVSYHLQCNQKCFPMPAGEFPPPFYFLYAPTAIAAMPSKYQDPAVPSEPQAEPAYPAWKAGCATAFSPGSAVPGSCPAKFFLLFCLSAYDKPFRFLLSRYRHATHLPSSLR